MSIYLRDAKQEDCDLLFKWSNEKEVRKNSFNKDQILCEEHIEWFNNKLKSDECFIFIGLNDKEKIGQVRIELRNFDAIISYSIDEKHRKKGYGFELLKILEEKIVNDKIKVNNIIGYVKYENIASQKIFETLGYKKIELEDKIEYIKNKI